MENWLRSERARMAPERSNRKKAERMSNEDATQRNRLRDWLKKA